MDFREFLLESIPHQDGSETTQIKNTIATYTKCAEIIKNKLVRGDVVLDYGAGLGYGTKAMQQVLGRKITVESLETGPKKWSPTYTGSDQIKKQYNAVVCLNVLNVLVPEIRDMVTENILSLVKDGGCVIIGTRSWVDDIAKAINVEPSEEDKAVWVLKNVGKVYQKGFDGSELLDYVNSFGSGIKFKKIGNLAKNTIIGFKE